MDTDSDEEILFVSRKARGRDVSIKRAVRDLNNEFAILVNVEDVFENLDWLQHLKFPVIKYVKNSTEPPYVNCSGATLVTNILRFITDFYDRLPENLVLINQYEFRPWQHKGSLLKLLNSDVFKNRYRARSSGFWNFNCCKLKSAENYRDKITSCEFWKRVMEPWFGSFQNFSGFPDNRAGGSQFVVSKRRILSLPRIFYENALEWVSKNRSSEDFSEGSPTSDFFICRYFELFWELIFSSVKNYEKPYFDLGKTRILATYGTDTFKIDVSSRISRFLVNNTLHIVKDINFLNVFEDSSPGCEKTLVIQVGEVRYVLCEKRTSDFRIEF